MKARVFVTLKPSVFDPQGHTIVEALHSLGYGDVADVRQGKFFEIDLNVATAARRPRQLAAEVADRVLANPVIESFRIELTAGRGAGGPADQRQEAKPMTFAVVVFPGSNCDHDAYHAVKHVLGQEARFVWHKDTSLGDADVVILPGGFSHGDYLRTGAIARFSPIMAGRAGVCGGRPARCSASATGSRSCSSAACCPARCCATAT